MSRYVYEANAHWMLHERGVVEAKDAGPALDFTVPPEFGGETGFWTPEHLLLAAVASCYVATFRGMAGKSNLEFHAIEVSVQGVIEKQDGYLSFTKIILRPQVRLEREEDRERATRLLEKADHGCLIARSLASDIVLQPAVSVDTPLTV